MAGIIVGCVVAVVLIAIIIFLLHKERLVYKPDEEPSHAEPVAERTKPPAMTVHKNTGANEYIGAAPAESDV